MSAEEEPALNIKLDGQEFEINRRNTMLYTFIGELAIYDHIFITTCEEEGRQTGTYIFKPNKGYMDLATFMMEKAFPAQLNMPRVADCDVQAFENHYLRDVRGLESFPEEWEAA